MRHPNPSRPPRRAKVGAWTLVGLVVLQQLTGILSDLAVALLPDGWAQRQAALIIVMLLIAIALIVLLQVVPLPLSHDSASTGPPGAGERHVGSTHTAPNLRAEKTATEPSSGRTRGEAWVDALRVAIEGTGEVLAIIGLTVRRLAWLVTRSTEEAKNKHETSDRAGRQQRVTPKPTWEQYSRNVAVGLATTILLFFVMASSGNPNPARDSTLADAGLTKLIEADPLANPSPLWPQDAKHELKQRGYSRSFAAHTYRISVQRPNTKVKSVADAPLLRSLSDAKVQVSARASVSASESWFGLLCRHQRDRYYVATISDTGEYQIAKVTNAGKRIISDGTTLSVKNSTVSVLELICTGGESGTPVKITLRANGELVAAEEDSLQPLLGSGSVGLYAETGDSESPEEQPSLEVAFEDFMVWIR